MNLNCGRLELALDRLYCGCLHILLDHLFDYHAKVGLFQFFEFFPEGWREHNWVRCVIIGIVVDVDEPDVNLIDLEQFGLRLDKFDILQVDVADFEVLIFMVSNNGQAKILDVDIHHRLNLIFLHLILLLVLSLIDFNNLGRTLVVDSDEEIECLVFVDTHILVLLFSVGLVQVDFHKVVLENLGKRLVVAQQDFDDLFLHRVIQPVDQFLIGLHQRGVL